MNLVNLTPHALRIVGADGIVVIPISGKEARVDMDTRVVGRVLKEGVEIPLLHMEAGEIEGLPEKQEDTMYITSTLVRLATPRTDVASPGPPIRDDEGKVIGAEGLVIN